MATEAFLVFLVNVASRVISKGRTLLPHADLFNELNIPNGEV